MIGDLTESLVMLLCGAASHLKKFEDSVRKKPDSRPEFSICVSVVFFFNAVDVFITKREKWCFECGTLSNISLSLSQQTIREMFKIMKTKIHSCKVN